MNYYYILPRKRWYAQQRTIRRAAAALILASGILLGGSVLGGHDTAWAVEDEGPSILGYLVIPAKLREAERPVRTHDKRTTTKAPARVEIVEEERAAEDAPEEESPSQTLRASSPHRGSQGAAAREDAPWWTEEELELLACTIYCEAGSDCISDETRLMVGQVVINRVNHPDYPDTIYDVLTQRGQYGRFFWTGVVWPSRAGRSVETHAVERAYDCAERVLGGEWLLPTDVIYQAGFVQGREIVAQAPGFYFCR